MNRIHRIIETVSSRVVLISFSLQAILLLKVAPLQIDPHHDGVILGAAIAASTGHLGPAGAFSQYGPLNPLIQGLFLRVFGNSMINLRYFAALNVICISILLFKLVKKISNSHSALIVSTLWVCTSAIWSTSFPGALLAWPSLISTGLTLGGLYLLLNYISSNLNSYRKPHWPIFVSGILIGLSGFARQQAWLAIPLAVLSLVLSNRGLHRNIIHFISGVAFALGCMLTWLVVIGSWQDYVNQVFIWPLTAYSTLGATNNYNRYQFFSYIIESLVFIVAVLVVAKLQARIKWRVASIGLALLFTLIITIDGFWISQQANWKASIRVVLGEPQEKILISFSYFSALAVLIYCVYYFFSKKFREFIVSPVEISIAFFGLVGVVQLYPQPDVLHLWWVAPLFIPGGLIAFKKLSQKFSGFPERSFYTTLNIFSMVGIIFAILFMNRPWIEYEIPVLKGTYALSDKVNAVNKFNLVRNQIIPGETSFDCADGIYAVSDRSYSPPDEWFVNWGMLKMDKSALGKVRIICNQSLEYATRESLRLGWNLKYYEKSNYGDISFAVLVQP